MQDAENKKCEKKESGGPPLQTASVSVRALIEEKIINKRITNPQATSAPPEDRAAPAPPLFPLAVHAAADLDAKITSFVVPAPPHAAAALPAAIDKARRHSDAEAFTVPRNPASSAASNNSSSSQDSEGLLKKDKAGVKRTTSDPGQPGPQIIRFQSAGDSFTLTGVTYQANEDGGYLSPSLQDEVFNQVIIFCFFCAV